MRYWKRVDNNGKTITVESYSHNSEIEGAIEITKIEFDAFIASLPMSEPIPTRDLAAEIDALKAKLKAAGIRI